MSNADVVKRDVQIRRTIRSTAMVQRSVIKMVLIKKLLYRATLIWRTIRKEV